MYGYDILVCSAARDAATARELKTSIEKYRLPGNVSAPDEDGGYSRVALDVSESALDESAERLLDDCRRLIVVCSPATKRSKPVIDRLLYFERTHSKSDIIAAIAEGEPLDAYPPFFIEEKTVAHILPDMSVVERMETIEPVACDLRADDQREKKARLRYETVRIVASVMGLAPDALEQRHARRRKRRIAAVCAVCSVILLAAAAVFARFGAEAKRAGDIYAGQAAQSVEAARRLMLELPETFAGDEKAEAAIRASIDEAVSALKDSGAAGAAVIGQIEEGGA